MQRTPTTVSAPMPVHDAVLPQPDTIELLLQQSKRRTETVPIRRAFVQDTEDVAALIQKPGPLHQLVRHEKALDLLLLLYMVTSGGDFGAVERAETWGRATALTFETNGSAGSAVSRLWNRLAALNLVARGTRGRLAKVTKLREDGSGMPYTIPSGGEKGPRKDVYFRLPFDYWRDELHKRLDMAGKVVLLIGMSLRQRQFSLPQTATFAGYYGISEATLRRGIATLIKEEVLTKTGTERYPTNETVTGWGKRTLYAFNPPYDLNVNNKDKAAMEAAADETPGATLAGLGPSPWLVPPRLPARSGPEAEPTTQTEGGEEK
ncbi:hypothetical protein AB0D10_41720 [Kitasatospora sp. NPDC048545]|uniref:hypothetical protein n=1 Tax=Kitasatospora sp. NPDC048545 TaxID=3157208 RepID=UPI0033FEBB75